MIGQPVDRDRRDTELAMLERLSILKRGHQAFNRGEDLWVVSDLTTPEVEWGAVGAFPGVVGSYQGPDALQRWAELKRRAAFTTREAALGAAGLPG